MKKIVKDGKRDDKKDGKRDDKKDGKRYLIEKV